MTESLLMSLHTVAQPHYLALLMLGVLMGIIVGVIPGVGGVTAIALLLPFCLVLSPENALAMLVGITAVTTTADTITCVLLGTPGTAGSMATIMDGYPMAKKGEAGRAMGAGFTASVIGGLIGAGVLALSIPVLRPIVLAFGSPEYFMMGMLGICMVAALTGRNIFRGIISGGLGLLVGMIGMDPVSGVARWSFGVPYLLEHVALVPLTLGLFAIPEIVDLFTRGTRIANVPKDKVKGVMSGSRDVLSNKTLVVTSALLGTWVGFIPALGKVVANWFAYSWGMMFCKGQSTFGKGDVRGVIAPEAANNAATGGELIPTIAFGIPGSSVMVLLLAAFMILGITPGPTMLTTQLNVTFSLVWTLTLGTVIGGTICFLLAKQIARLTLIRFDMLAPLVLVVIFAGSMVATLDRGDVILLIATGFFGWCMKKLNWPRPPFVLAFVLVRVLEKYFFISKMAYGLAWLYRPGVLAIGAFGVITLLYSLRLQRRTRA